MPAVTLLVPFRKQVRTGLCGAACVQMLLESKNVVGFTQEQIFDEIKQQTLSIQTSGPQGTGPDRSACPPFPGKICEQCALRSFCWCTHPEALKRTIDHFLGNNTVQSVSRTVEADITDRAIACLNKGLAPVVLVHRGQHWVVVYGHDPGAPLPLSVHDPALKATIGVTISRWNAAYLIKMDCGAFNGVYVLVGS